MRKALAALAAGVGMTILAGPASAHLIDSKVHANNLRVCNNRCVNDVTGNVSVDVLP
jgi:hypothetical protein